MLKLFSYQCSYVTKQRHDYFSTWVLNLGNIFGSTLNWPVPDEWFQSVPIEIWTSIEKKKSFMKNIGVFQI